MTKTAYRASPSKDNGRSYLDTQTDRVLFASELSEIPLDWLVPFLANKTDNFIDDTLASIMAYVDKIPADSIKGKQIAKRRVTA